MLTKKMGTDLLLHAETRYKAGAHSVPTLISDYLFISLFIICLFIYLFIYLQIFQRQKNAQENLTSRKFPPHKMLLMLTFNVLECIKQIKLAFLPRDDTHIVSCQSGGVAQPNIRSICCLIRERKRKKNWSATGSLRRI